MYSYLKKENVREKEREKNLSRGCLKVRMWHLPLCVPYVALSRASQVYCMLLPVNFPCLQWPLFKHKWIFV